MDTSEIYIKMCEKAEEIQKLKKNPTPFVGMVFHGNSIVINNGDWWFIEDVCGMSPTWDVWLPRQDQLQEMIPNWSKEYYLQIGKNILFDQFRPKMLVLDNGDEVIFATPDSLISFEQLWLAFVMKEKYNKIWNGEEWVLDEKSK